MKWTPTKYAKAHSTVFKEIGELDGILIQHPEDARFFAVICPIMRGDYKAYRIRGIRPDREFPFASDCCTKAKVAINWARSLLTDCPKAFATARETQ